MIATFCFILLLARRTGAQANFLFIVVDDLRAALGCYGDSQAHTPNIDKLAENSILFDNVYAQQALCAPSRNSFLTSRRPDTLGLYDFYSYWRNTVGNLSTLPEHLKNHGYRTKSVGKIFHPGVSCNFSDDSPYSWSEKPFHPYTNRYKNAAVCRSAADTTKSPLSKNLVCPVTVKETPRGTLPDLETLDAAKRFIKNYSKDARPFFLAVGFQKPHIPLKYPREYLNYHPLTKFSLPNPYEWPRNISTVAYNPWSDIRERKDVEALSLEFPWEKIPVDFAKTIMQSYYAAVSYIDDLVGMLLEQLRVSMIRDNTVVVLTSDHGWSLGEHAEWAKYSNFEVALRVPLLISTPHRIDRLQSPISSSPRGQVHRENGTRREGVTRVDAMVELVDIFPTIADLAGLPIPICFGDRYPVRGGGPLDDTSGETGAQHPPLPPPNLCSEGISLMPLIRATLQHKSLPWKKGAFSQYPRPGLEPTLHPNSDKPRLGDINIMGYSLRTKRFRYTAWVPFDHTTKKPNWNETAGEELYDHRKDPGENTNVASNPRLVVVKRKLRTLLKRGWPKALPTAVHVAQ